ncbi:hypothetical protein RIF29_10533 [Crotalaria pallida]|uniref:Uncharacterized protein n=1 Tax=Crotalaria pallida TaxID=3830 RepID=A0AAN9FZ32_CROPI
MSKKKRGRPPKTPSSSQNPQTPSKDPFPIDFDALDDLNLDNLSPKKQGELLSLLDEIKNRIQKKPDPVVQDSVVHQSGTLLNKDSAEKDFDKSCTQHAQTC